MLEGLSRWSDEVWLLTRVLVGGFLMWGVVDNIVDAADMAKFAAFLAAHGFPAPDLAAPLSVYTQFLGGLGLALGLFTRWAGLLIAANFVVALVMVDRFAGLRGAFPAAALVLFGLYAAAYGAGRLGLDRVLARRRGG